MDLKSVIDHLFLPPQLPQQEDDSDLDILRIAVDALVQLGKVTNFASNAIRDAKFSLSVIESTSKDRATAIRRILLALTIGQTMVVHVAAQNAGILITREKENQLVFEQFELSPHNKAVYSSQGRLVRSFPASAIAIDSGLLQQDDFAAMIADTISTMASQAVPDMKPQSKKSGTGHSEDRDTCRPAVVSELLFGVLTGIGKSHQATSISKNTREEVLWKNARRNWRRSPMWLLIRVALQLTTTRTSNGSKATYKNTMLFVLAHVLNLAQALNVPSEMYYVMSAKLNRRRQKLLATKSLDHTIAQFVEKALQTNFATLSTRWKELQASDVPKFDMEQLKGLDFKTDTHVQLRALDEYISSITNRQSSAPRSGFSPSTKLLKSNPDELPPLPAIVDDEYGAANLQQFENWVALHRQAWMKKCHRADACKQLGDLIKRYHILAQELYSKDPEHTSVMLLTILELWMACDQAGVQTSPLLAKYDAGVPAGVCQNLLLRHFGQMQRLSTVEEYILSREGNLSSTLLSDAKHQESFASQYFDSSEKHKALLRTIISQAEDAKRAKMQELGQRRADYTRLNNLHQRADCEYETTIIDDFCDSPETKTVHLLQSCKKCAYMQQRDSVTIGLFEWPLPRDMTQAKIVVFELQSPDWFVHWRDARLYLLNEVLSGRQDMTKLRSVYRLSSDDPHLSRRHYKAVTKRIGLVSQTKPAAATHYSTKVVANLDEAQVCVPNGLDYNYYDSITKSFEQVFTFDETIPTACTYVLPIGMSSLQRFLLRPSARPDGQLPNASVARQNACPSNMTLEEYKDLSSIPLGHHIQWSNINLQLAMPSVDFKKLATTLVFLQCIYQAGPPASSKDAHRESHTAIKGEAMVKSVLENLHLALSRIKQNWLSIQALSTLVAIAARILSLNDLLATSYLSFLSAAREVAVDWILTLREKAHGVEGHAERTDLIARAVEVALVCASTFDVDDEHLKAILRSPQDSKLLAWISIVVQEGHHALSKTNSYVSVLALRFKRLLHRSYQTLKQNKTGIDGAVLLAWSAYKPGKQGWAPISTKADHWITTEVAATSSDTAAAQAYVNLLTGELLVNGLPLDQPPPKYREHALFKTLFCNARVEVMPTSEPGFEFSTKRSFGGSQVQLGMKNGQLLVRSTGESGTFETVPSKVLRDKYPLSFSDNFVLWYETTEKNVELRPVRDPWNSQSSEKWTLSQKGFRNACWNLGKDGTSVTGTGSHTSCLISQMLAPLAQESHMHCILQPPHDLLVVEIPSMRLKFSLAKHSTDLRSLEYCSMSVDHNQNLGTLIGFTKKLVLKSQGSNERMVLLLAANVSYAKRDDHVLVKASTASTTSKAKVFAVRVDHHLKRMVPSNDVDCKLYMAYLHVLTSFCLPDPLTLKTGTEEALDILRSKGVASFEQLSQANIDVLQKIAELSPTRHHYPANDQVMQQVGWDSELGFLSQHGEFAVVVASLFRQSQSMSFFYPKLDVKFPRPRLNDVVDGLRHRDAIRSSAFRLSGSRAESHTAALDKTYASRDRGVNSTLCRQVATVVGLVNRVTDSFHWPAATQNHLWSLMQKHTTVHGVNEPVQVPSLKSGIQRRRATERLCTCSDQVPSATTLVG